MYKIKIRKEKGGEYFALFPEVKTNYGHFFVAFKTGSTELPKNWIEENSYPIYGKKAKEVKKFLGYTEVEKIVEQISIAETINKRVHNGNSKNSFDYESYRKKRLERMQNV